MEEKLKVIEAHPRIGAPKKTLSALSYQEQGYTKAAAATTSASVASTTEEEKVVMDRLAALNAEYEKKYGFPFVVFVAGRSKREIIPVMEERIKNGTRDGELTTGLTAMMLIAADRLKKLQPKL